MHPLTFEKHNVSGPFSPGHPTASYLGCILGTKTRSHRPHPPSCRKQDVLFLERSPPCFLRGPADHWDSFQLQRLHDSNNFENEVYSQGPDLSPCQPPIHRSRVKSSSRSPKQRAAWTSFFPEPMYDPASGQRDPGGWYFPYRGWR